MPKKMSIELVKLNRGDYRIIFREGNSVVRCRCNDCQSVIKNLAKANRAMEAVIIENMFKD